MCALNFPLAPREGAICFFIDLVQCKAEGKGRRGRASSSHTLKV